MAKKTDCRECKHWKSPGTTNPRWRMWQFCEVWDEDISKEVGGNLPPDDDEDRHPKCSKFEAI